MFISCIQQYKAVLSNRSYRINAIWGIVLLTLGIGSVWYMKLLLAGYPPEYFSWSHDLFLDLLPAMSTQGIVEWGPLIIAFGALFTVLCQPAYLPFAAKTVGLLSLVRAFFIVLTPLGIRSDQVTQGASGLLSHMAYSGNDFFFSGHVSYPFLLALIFWKKKYARAFFLVLTVTMAVGVLLEHIHYSIDVFASFPIVWSTFFLSTVVFKHDLQFIRE